VRIEYDRATDQAYIYLREIAAGDARTQVPVFQDGIHIVLDLDVEGRLIGLDVMGASGSLPRDLLDKATVPTPPSA
jgi:uncharacterized protein YuzE